ncbi:hypothetical protein SAMN05421846_10862 [Chryseobacterium taeanense]|uniref:Uncharacterized protein n=1 Tax=Chryseobacterium taeanense TaxID=311334 RepID=A0A1G8KU92_9FLAO|nr:hypothetical protein [Chryseobacterium taeanense]SDI47008.1 hypothetical protein SAMN05421846_10862 [Chryseobacterium taeanense]
MKKYVLTVVLSLLPLISFAQNSDSLKLGKSNREFFIKGDQKFKFSEYKKVFTNPEALSYMKKANTNSTVSQIFGAVGGGLIGFGLVKEVTRNKTVYYNGVAIKEKDKGGWALIGAGLGAIGIGIPFALSAQKNLKKAVDTQNQNPGTDETKATSYRIDISGNSIGLTYNF